MKNPPETGQDVGLSASLTKYVVRTVVSPPAGGSHVVVTPVGHRGRSSLHEKSEVVWVH